VAEVLVSGRGVGHMVFLALATVGGRNWSEVVRVCKEVDCEFMLSGGSVLW
jgi:hypothetical protein